MLDALGTEPLGENVGHGLRREGNVEREFGVVAGHGGNGLRMSVRMRTASAIGVPGPQER